MKYRQKRWSEYYGGNKKYSDGWERVFGNKDPDDKDLEETITYEDLEEMVEDGESND